MNICSKAYWIKPVLSTHHTMFIFWVFKLRNSSASDCNTFSSTTWSQVVLMNDPELSESVSGRRNGNTARNAGKSYHKKWHVIDHQCFHQLFYPVIHVIFPTISVGPQTLTPSPPPRGLDQVWQKELCSRILLILIDPKNITKTPPIISLGLWVISQTR